MTASDIILCRMVNHVTKPELSVIGSGTIKLILEWPGNNKPIPQFIQELVVTNKE